MSTSEPASRSRLPFGMRWWGPDDPVPLAHLAQAGCDTVITALHQIPVGAVWTREAIRDRKAAIEAEGMSWRVVESLPVHEDIKRRQGAFRTYIDHYRQSLRNLAAEGIEVVTYNFMPVLDWLRTDVAHRLPDGAETLRFDPSDFAVADLFLLERPGAERSYTAEQRARYRARFDAMSSAARERLLATVLLGLPGSNKGFTREEVLDKLQAYDGLDRRHLKDHLIAFLKDICPAAAEAGVLLAIHPDDPPFPVLGLPRVMSTEADAAAIFRAVPSRANGLCFCTGSFGARPDNDLPGMVRRWGSRIYFLHLRNTRRAADGSFMEAPHLEGDADMYAIMREIVALQEREGRSIPIRPDHGFRMLDDLEHTFYPGYAPIGRLKGLAELRGLYVGAISNRPVAAASAADG